MIEVTLETIQMSLVSPHRIVVLKALDEERYLPIWIGPCEAEAISVRLNHVEMPRPLTHDLVVRLLERLGATLRSIHITSLSDNTFYARLVLDVRGSEIAVDCRPSDAIAIAVRLEVPIFVAESVLDDAGIIPEPDLVVEEGQDHGENLGVFRDFLKKLDSDQGPENEG